MTAALPTGAARFQYYVKRLDDWIAAIEHGAAGAQRRHATRGIETRRFESLSVVAVCATSC